MILGIFTFMVSILNTICMHILLTRKKAIIHCVITFLLNSLIIFSAAFFAEKYISNQTILKYVIYFLAFLYYLYIYITFEESNSKKLFTMFSVWMFSTIILFFATTLADLFGKNIDQKSIQNYLYLIRICLQVLLLPVVYFWLRKIYKKALGIVPDKIINLMSMYPIIAFLILVRSITESMGHYSNFSSVYDMLFFLIFISIGYLLVFAGISYSSTIISLQYNYRVIENQVELQRQNYRKLNESIELFHTHKHDVRHHISAMETMVRQQKYEEALKYIQQFNQNDLSEIAPTLCNNFTADSIIKYYMSLALSKAIDFTTNITIPEEIGINPLDLCVVLGNSLDNAIDACEKLSTSEKKYIELSTKIDGQLIFINIKNSFNGKIEKANNIIKSSKEGPYHGFGLPSINETVNKYNGNVDIKFTEDKFEITIIMCATAL